jgi:hypothetical protein
MVLDYACACAVRRPSMLLEWARADCQAPHISALILILDTRVTDDYTYPHAFLRRCEMPTIKVDDEVFGALENRVQGFGDSPNAVLRRILEIAHRVEVPRKQVTSTRAGRGILLKRERAPKTDLGELIRVESLMEGQPLFMHDYQGNRIEGIEAVVRGNYLEFEGQRTSMSAVTSDLMQKAGFQGTSYRGPQFWYTADGKSVKELWDEYLRNSSEQ